MVGERGKGEGKREGEDKDKGFTDVEVRERLEGEYGLQFKVMDGLACFSCSFCIWSTSYSCGTLLLRLDHTYISSFHFVQLM